MKATQTNSQNGQSLIIIALMIVGIFGFLGLVLDGGQVLLTRRNSQDAADAAAFAAVRVLATKGTEQAIYNTALDYARVNQVITNTDVTVAYIDQNGNQIRTINPASFGTVPDSPLATGVRVTATIRLQPYFIDVLIGNNPIPIQSVAAAQSGPPSIASDLKPMGIICPDPTDPKCKYAWGVTVRLFGDSLLSGAFQWLDFKQKVPGSIPSSNCTIEDYLWLTCTSGPVVADKSDTYYDRFTPTNFNSMPPPSPWIASNTGVQLSSVSDPLDCWIQLGTPNQTYHNGTRTCWKEPNQGGPPSNRLWTIPVFNHDNGLTGNNAMFHTYMFAEFEFQAYYWGPGQCNWVGKTGNGCDPSTAPLAFQQLLTTCATNNEKCIIGAFQKVVKSFQIKPGACNTMGLDLCAYGLSQ
jgi:hypothetical protein